MADRPILFSGSMIRAILAGRKTQTRRLFNLPKWAVPGTLEIDDDGPYACAEVSGCLAKVPTRINVGDHLWVREGWWIATRYSYGTTPGGCEVPPPPLAYRRSDPVHYASDGDPKNHGNRHYGPDGLRPGSGAFAAPDPYAVWLKKPSIHMPRWASRITLKVTDVRVERLHDISEQDAVAEGCFKGKASGRVFASEAAMHLGGDEWATARDWYADLWDSINSEDTWDTNPWVAAYTFTVECRNIDAPTNVAKGGGA